MNNDITFACEKFLTVYDGFMYPISSTKLGSCKVSRYSISKLQLLSVSVVFKKCLPTNDDSSEYFIIPLLH